MREITLDLKVDALAELRRTRRISMLALCSLREAFLVPTGV